MTFTPLEITLLLLGSAVLGVVAFRMLQLPPMLGYLAVGILIGPHALGLAEESEVTHALAEFGVVFLMFTIGLEFTIEKLGAGSYERTCATAGEASAVRMGNTINPCQRRIVSSHVWFLLVRARMPQPALGGNKPSMSAVSRSESTMRATG